ncbi:hypothetical protein ACFL5N_02660, partial [bacterium]
LLEDREVTLKMNNLKSELFPKENYIVKKEDITELLKKEEAEEKRKAEPKLSIHKYVLGFHDKNKQPLSNEELEKRFKMKIKKEDYKDYSGPEELQRFQKIDDNIDFIESKHEGVIRRIIKFEKQDKIIDIRIDKGKADIIVYEWPEVKDIAIKDLVKNRTTGDKLMGRRRIERKVSVVTDFIFPGVDKKIKKDEFESLKKYLDINSWWDALLKAKYIDEDGRILDNLKKINALKSLNLEFNTGVSVNLQTQIFEIVFNLLNKEYTSLDNLKTRRKDLTLKTGFFLTDDKQDYLHFATVESKDVKKDAPLILDFLGNEMAVSDFCGSRFPKNAIYANYSRRGEGLSSFNNMDTLSEDTAYRDGVKFVLEMAKKFPEGDIILHGRSLGGGIAAGVALIIARDYPEIYKRLKLLSLDRTFDKFENAGKEGYKSQGKLQKFLGGFAGFGINLFLSLFWPKAHMKPKIKQDRFNTQAKLKIIGAKYPTLEVRCLMADIDHMMKRSMFEKNIKARYGDKANVDDYIHEDAGTHTRFESLNEYEKILEFYNKLKKLEFKSFIKNNIDNDNVISSYSKEGSSFREINVEKINNDVVKLLPKLTSEEMKEILASNLKINQKDILKWEYNFTRSSIKIELVKKQKEETKKPQVKKEEGIKIVEKQPPKVVKPKSLEEKFKLLVTNQKKQVEDSVLKNEPNEPVILKIVDREIIKDLENEQEKRNLKDNKLREILKSQLKIVDGNIKNIKYKILL